jgi:hypothetical protein
VASRLPQDVAVLKLYPFEKLELQAYYFPNITRDPIIQDYIDEGLINYDSFGESTLVKVVQPDSDKEYQTAARLMYFGDYATIGLTYYDGWEQYFSSNPTLGLSPVPGNSGTFNYNSFYNPKVEKIEMIGLETAIPVGRWTWKLDVSSYKANLELEPFYYNVDSFQTDYQEKLDLISWIQNSNDGRLYIPIRQTLVAAGFDYSSSRWLINFMLLHFRQDFESKEYEEKYELSKRLYYSEEASFNIDTVPTFNVTRYFNDSKETAIGLAAGVFGSGAGVTLYFKDTLFESLTYGVSYEYIEYFGDDSFNGLEYQVKPNTGGYRVGATYKF